MNHLTEETLSALLDGEVDREEALSAEAHLGECDECRNALEGIRRTARLLGRLERLATPDHLADEVAERVKRRTVIDAADRWHVMVPVPKPRPFWMSAAASVVLMVVLVYVVAQMKTWKPLGEEAAPREEPHAAQAVAPRGEGEAGPRETIADRRDVPGQAPAEAGEAEGAALQDAWNRSAPLPEPAAGRQEAPAKKGKMSRGAAPPAGRLEEAEAAEEKGDGDKEDAAEVLLAREDRKAVEKQERETEKAPSRSADAFSAAAPPAAPATMEVGETRVRLVKDGEALGELRIRLGGVQAGAGARGIRILCDPDGGPRYGSEENPVKPEQGPDGFVWPKLERAPERFQVGAVGAAAADEGEEDAPEGELRRLLKPAAPAPVPPPIAFSLEGKIVIDREGRARASGVPPWLAGPLAEVSFQAGRCSDGEPAAVEVPFEAEWAPAD